MKYTKVLRHLEVGLNGNKMMDPEEIDYTQYETGGSSDSGINWTGTGRTWTSLLDERPNQQAYTVQQAYQQQINICNAANRDCWFIFPTFENATLRDALIDAIEDPVTGLNDGLSAYVEWGNELWNTGTRDIQTRTMYAFYQAWQKACINYAYPYATQSYFSDDVPTPACVGSADTGWEDLEARVEESSATDHAEGPMIGRYMAWRLWDIADAWETAYPNSIASGRLKPVLGFQASNEPRW